MQSNCVIRQQIVCKGISQIQNRPTSESVIVFRPLVSGEQVLQTLEALTMPLGTFARLFAASLDSLAKLEVVLLLSSDDSFLTVNRGRQLVLNGPVVLCRFSCGN